MRQRLALIMNGYPATGKTYLTKQLISLFKKKYKTVTVSTLDFRKKHNLFNMGCNEEREKIYGLLANHIEAIAGSDDFDILIIDGNFNKRLRRQKLYSILKDEVVYVIKCVVHDEKVIYARLADRRQNHYLYENKAATMELYSLIKDDDEPLEDDEPIKQGIVGFIQYNSGTQMVEKVHPRINCQSKDKIIKDILEFLSSKPDITGEISNA